MRSLRSNISSQSSQGGTPLLWQLAQTVWLGAHISYLFLFLPVLQQIGLAPLLVAEINSRLWPGILVLSVMALLVQTSLVWRSFSLRNARTLLLLTALVCCFLLIVLLFAGLNQGLPAKAAHGVLLGCGLLGMLLPLPQNSARE